MSLNPANILAGPARVFTDVTPPLTGAPPSQVSHVSGVPVTGKEVGYTNSAVEFTYKATKQEINPEQSYMPVDVFLQSEMAQVTFEALERTFNTLLIAMDNVGNVSDTTKDMVYFGNGLALVTPRTSCIVFTSPRRDNSTKFTVGCLYKCYSVDGAKLPFTKTKPMSYQVTLMGLADVNRSQGDQGGQLYIEK